MLETDIFRPDNYQRIRNNLSAAEQKSLEELRSLYSPRNYEKVRQQVFAVNICQFEGISTAKI